MIDPPRLLDDAAGLEREILASAIDDEPSAERRKRVVAGIGVAAVAVSASSVASRVASWKVAVAAASIAAASAAVGIAQTYRSDSEVGVQARHIEAPAVESAPAKRAVRLEELDAEPPVVAEPEVPREIPAPPAPVRATRPVVEPEPAAPSISREILLIDRARTAKSKGQSKEALAALDEYDREWPRGALSVEAEVLRIEVLGAAGDDQSAAEKARVFLEAHPRSPYEARVRAYVKNP